MTKQRLSMIEDANTEGEVVSLVACWMIDNGLSIDSAKKAYRQVSAKFGEGSMQDNGAWYALKTYLQCV